LKILICGNMGYVGPAVVSHLRSIWPNATLHGFDSGLFAHCLSGSGSFPEHLLDAQHFGDVRSLEPGLLAGFDAVVQLAAVSNDPMGQRFADATGAINRGSTSLIAEAAAKAGVGRFVFASSCSVYGIAEGGPRTEEDAVAPETAYAHSKVEAEQDLLALGGDMVITALRFATACGPSPRLRLDLVLNDFVAAALRDRRIVVLSDGTPWRPLIDVRDMARAIEWALTRDLAEGGEKLIVNTGANSGNYQVRGIAEAVARAIPGTEVSINSNAPVDSRSYQVDFSRYAKLAPDHLPACTLDQSIEGLIGILKDFQGSPASLIRLKVLEEHLGSGRLDQDLRWLS
jgi:UDP-glucose 4-epimerase